MPEGTEAALPVLVPIWTTLLPYLRPALQAAAKHYAQPLPGTRSNPGGDLSALLEALAAVVLLPQKPLATRILDMVGSGWFSAALSETGAVVPQALQDAAASATAARGKVNGRLPRVISLVPSALLICFGMANLAAGILAVPYATR